MLLFNLFGSRSQKPLQAVEQEAYFIRYSRASDKTFELTLGVVKEEKKKKKKIGSKKAFTP